MLHNSMYHIRSVNETANWCWNWQTLNRRRSLVTSDLSKNVYDSKTKCVEVIAARLKDRITRWHDEKLFKISNFFVVGVFQIKKFWENFVEKSLFHRFLVFAIRCRWSGLELILFPPHTHTSSITHLHTQACTPTHIHTHSLKQTHRHLLALSHTLKHIYSLANSPAYTQAPHSLTLTTHARTLSNTDA